MNFCLGLKNKNADKNLTIDNVFSFLPLLKIQNKGLFEFLQADQTFVKPYFDYDPEFDQEQTPIEINNFINMKKFLLCKFFGDIIKDKICVYGSQRKITKSVNRKKVEKFKLSLHIIVDEHYISRETLQTIVKKIKKYEEKNKEKTIDCGVYSITKQKFRSIYCVKDGLDDCSILYPWIDYQFDTKKDENHFKQSLIQNFNTETAVYLEEVEYDDFEYKSELNDKPINNERAGFTISEKNINALLNLLPSEYYEDYDGWKSIGIILTNEQFDDSIFHNFSSKSSEKYSYERTQEFIDSIRNSHRSEEGQLRIGTLYKFLEGIDYSHIQNRINMENKSNIEEIEKIKESVTTITTNTTTGVQHFKNTIDELAKYCKSNEIAFDYRRDVVYKKIAPIFYKAEEFDDTNKIEYFIRRVVFPNFDDFEHKESIMRVLMDSNQLKKLVDATNIPALGFKQHSYCRDIISFKNGYINISEWIFYNYDNVPDNTYARCHFDIDFDETLMTRNWKEIETPNFDHIIDSQELEPDVALVCYGLLGQLQFPKSDNNFQVGLYISGTAGTGKSTLLNPILDTFPQEKIGVFNDQDSKFGYESLINTFLCLHSDAPDNLIERIDPTKFKAILSDETILINRKNKSDIRTKLNTNVIILSNHKPNVNECGDITRRLAYINFKPIKGKGDTNLKYKLKKENPYILLKTILAYRFLKEKYEGLSFESWGIDYFSEQKETTLYDNNPVFSFIEDRDDFMTNPTKDGFDYCKFVDFKTEFERTNKKYKLKMSDMTFNRLGLATKQELLCSHCQSLPGYKCCPKKSNTDRKKVRVIIGLKQITSNIIYDDDDTEVL